MASILAVDDSISMRQMLTITLRNAGHQVTAVEDGAGALEIAREKNFDLVITDLRMPRMDGIRLIRELRKLPDFASIPLFLLTTEAAAESKKAGRNAGASGWIEKPVAADRLLALVSEVLGYEGDRTDAAGNSRLENRGSRI